MARRGHEQEVDEAEASGELNLVPYLDIITTLVIFLIFTFQVIIEFRLIELLPPAYSAQARQENPNPDKPQVQLTLFIHSQGYKLVTDQPELGTVDIPKRGNDYDTGRLAQELDRVKKSLELSESLIVTATDDLEYQVVVAAMDAAREYEGRLLFPDVLLAKASVGGE